MADLTGSKIQIMNGAGTNMFPRVRAKDMVDNAGVDLFDNTTWKIKADYLPSYVDDVIEIKYIGAGTNCPTFAKATHSGTYYYKNTSNTNGDKGLYFGTDTAWVPATAITADAWVEGNVWQTGKIYVDVGTNGTVEGTYRWTGTAPVKITEAPIASTTNVRPWTATGTAVNSFVPTELAVANAISSGVASAKADIPTTYVRTIKGTAPIGPTTAQSGDVTMTLSYGTGKTHGVGLSGTTTLSAVADLASPTAEGTVKTINKTADGISTANAALGLDAPAAGTSAYIVPTWNTLYYVTSLLQSKIDSAQSNAVSKHGHTTVVSNGVQLYESATGVYGARAALAGTANTSAGTVITSNNMNITADPATVYGLDVNGVGKSGYTSMHLVPTMNILYKVASNITSRINKAVADKGRTAVAVVGPISNTGGTTTPTLTLKYGTAAVNGVALGFDATTSTLSAAASKATTGAYGTVVLAGAGYSSKAHLDDVMTQSMYDTMLPVYKVTSIYTTSASALAGASGAGVGHAGQFYACPTAVYKCVATAADATSAVLVTTQVKNIYICNDQTTQNGNFYKNNGTSFIPVLTSADATTVAGTAASVTNNANGTVTVKIPTSVASATSAGNVAWGNVYSKPNIVNTVTSNGDGIRISPTSGAVVIYTSRFKGADGTNAGSSGMVPAPAKADNNKYLKGDGTWGTPANTTDHSHADTKTNGVQLSKNGTVWTARADAATTAAYGTVQLAATLNALKYSDAGDTVITKTENNRPIKTYLVTSVYTTSANAVTGVTTMSTGHTDEYVAADTGEIYQIKSTGANTTSALLIVGAGDKHLLMKNGDGGPSVYLLTASSALSAGTAANTDKVGGSAAATVNSAFIAVTQAGSVMTFSRVNGGTTNHTVTSAQYALSAGNGGVTSVKGANGLTPTTAQTGAVTLSGVTATTAAIGVVKLAGVGVGAATNGYNTTSHATDVITESAFNALTAFTNVTSIYATDAAAITGCAGAGAGHLGHFFAGLDNIYKVAVSGTGTSAQLVGPANRPFYVTNNNTAQNKRVYGNNGTKPVPLCTSVLAGTNTTVTDNGNGTFTVNASYTNSVYYAASVDETLAGTNSTKYVTPSSLNGTRKENFAVTGTTSAGIAAATSKQYIPTVHAILDQCLFYSTIA